jgi:hypothetical protein
MSRADKLIAKNRSRIAAPPLPPIEPPPPTSAFTRLRPEIEPQTEWIRANSAHPGLRPDGHMR